MHCHDLSLGLLLLVQDVQETIDNSYGKDRIEQLRRRALASPLIHSPR